MSRKVSFFIAAIAIVAIAVPALAAAQPATDPPGTLVPVGTKIELTNVGAVTTQTSLGSASCAGLTLTGEVTVNTPSVYVASGSGTSTASTCTLGGKAITITDVTWPEEATSTSGKGMISLTFVADLPNGIVCHFSGTVPFTYTPGGASTTITNGDLKGTPAACEPGLFNAVLTRETDKTNVHIILD